MIYYGNTDIGKRRLINQDSFRAMSIWGGEAILLVVCDGMGGHKAGEVASKKAVDAFCESIFARPCTDEDAVNEETIKAYIRYVMVSSGDIANSTVYNLSCSNEEYRGMGTTMVAALIFRNRMYIMNIGDSRLYRITVEGTEQITKDHSFVQDLIDTGKLTPEEARDNPRKNIITRAIGVTEKPSVDFFYGSLDAKGHGYLLLCTDGLSNYTDDKTLFDMIYTPEDPSKPETEDDLTVKVDKLIAYANDCGGNDNITAIIAEF